MGAATTQSAIGTIGVFADWGRPSEDWLNILQELGATDVVLGVNKDSAPFELVMSAQEIGQAVAAAQQAGLNVHLMIWLLPARSFIEDSSRTMVALVQQIPGISSLLFDVEASWIHASPAPDANTASFVTAQYAGIGVPLGVTSYAFLPANVRPLVAQVNYGVPQAYALYTPNGAPRDIPAPKLQNEAYNSWSSATRDIRMGLAAYEQTGPGGTLETMRCAVDATQACGLTAVFYWSLRASHVQSRQFISSLANAANAANS